MKASIVISLLILAIGTMLGVNDHRRLVTVRAEHDNLVIVAKNAGILLSSEHSTEGLRLTKHGRDDKEYSARQSAKYFISLVNELAAAEKTGKPSDEDMQEKVLEAMDRMMSLDAAQLKLLIAEFRSTPDLDDEWRRNLMSFTIMTLASNQPRAALSVIEEYSYMFKDSKTALISSSLSKWAKEDPMAALNWLRANSEKFPDIVNEDTKRGMISGAAANDPKLAFSLIRELDIKDLSSSINRIIDATHTPEDRTATLAALREHVASLINPIDSEVTSNLAVIKLAQSAAKDGFESGSKWIADAGFTPDQLKAIGTGAFSYTIKSEDTGKWVQWLGETMPNGKSDEGIRNIVSNWTQKDYQAAGKWLATTPNGPTKEASVRAYAETISKYDPDTAAQWAVTLPTGINRDEALRNIYRNWPKTDETSQAAAEAFANQHGIK